MKTHVFEHKRFVQKNKHYDLVMNIVRSKKFVNERVSYLRELGYNIDRRPMGSGVVGSVVKRNNEIRIQISYGKGKFNYAYCVIINN